MLLEIFRDSFEYSFKEKKSILSLGVLLFLSIFIVPIFLINGYSYRIIKIGVNGMINGNDPLPEFKNIGTIFLEGIKIFIVRFIYLIPGAVVLILFSIVNISISVIGKHETPEYSVFLFIQLGIIAISIVIWLISLAISNVAIPHMIANKESLKFAFKIKDILNIIKSIGFYEYIEFYTGYIVLYLGIISAAFLLIILIGLIFGLILSPIIGPIALGYSTGFMFIFYFLSAVLIIYPFFMIFENRAIALMYNTREN
ncbi:MAG: DUF4013 domain-containing protein [Methanobacteriaceae archaeon]|jgi:hypothetical protein|nr:DUF4013 domain-containing protein [Candidatus Methanorudis spinitermitis]